ncbi:MAG: TolC family protein [Campylobacterota bacterium]
MNKFYLSLLLASLAFSETIDFDTALNMTLKNNNDLKNSKLDIENSKLDIKKVDGYNYGKITIENQTSRTNHSGYVFNSKLSSREASFDDFGAMEFMESNNPNIEPKNLNHPKARTNITTKISYDIPLFTGFKLQNQKEILKLQKKAQKLRYELSKKELSYEVLKAYNAAVVAKNLIKAVNKAYDTMQYVLKTAQEFNNEGLVTKIDVKQAKVHKLNVKSELIQAQNRFDLAISYLRFLTTNHSINDVKSLKTIKYNYSHKNTLLNTALANRDELKMQKLNKKAMKKNVEVAKSEYLPTLYSHLEYGFNDDKLTLQSDKDYYNAMIGVKYTLFDKTRDIQKQKSKIAYQKANINLQKLKDSINLQLQEVLHNAKAKAEILKEKKEALALAKDIFTQSNMMYKNKLISMTNLLKQETNLRDNEVQLIFAKYENSLALAKLALVTGKKFTKKN